MSDAARMPCEKFLVAPDSDGSVAIDLHMIELYTKPPVILKASLSPDEAELLAHLLLGAASLLRKGPVPPPQLN